MSYKELTDGIVANTPETARAEIEYLVEAGIRIADAENAYKIEEINGHKYLVNNGGIRRIEPVKPEDEPQPAPFTAFSLAGLVEYIKTDVDGLFNAEGVRHIVSITDVDTVKVYTPITGYSRKRHVIAQCMANNPRIPFDHYMEPEDFQIMVQTRFKDSDNRKTVLQLSGNIRNEQSMQTADDGVSQKITIKKGVATNADVIVTNPVELTPLRTFYEVDQPSSPFVLRFNDKGEAALFEGDGGAWKLKAVENIRKWLSTSLFGYPVEIIA